MPSLRLALRGRTLALAAAYGGGSVGIFSAATAAVLITEAKLARRWIGRPTAKPPLADGLYGAAGHLPLRPVTATPLRFVMLGDSSAAGFGVHEPAHTPGGLLATGLARASGRPVELTNVARVGAQSRDLDDQVTRALQAGPDVAVIMVGANDVTHQVRPSDSVRLLEDAVRRLRAARVEVVVGTCPDLGTVEPVAQPLRYIARRWSRQLAAAQTVAVVQGGGRTVSLGDILGPEFAARPRELFGPDRFHPSSAGYQAAAMALLPSVCAAVGCATEASGDDDATPPRSVADAAAVAAEDAGTEVAPVTGPGSEGLARGRWASLRRRRPSPLARAGQEPASPLGPAVPDAECPPGEHSGSPDLRTA